MTTKMAEAHHNAVKHMETAYGKWKQAVAEIAVLDGRRSAAARVEAAKFKAQMDEWAERAAKISKKMGL